MPKIFFERIPPRTLVREPQLAEQLVEVPTIVSLSSLQRIMEQTVDIPVPQGGGRHADLQGFLRGQISTGVEQIVDIPSGGLHRPGQSSSSADELGEGGFRTFPQHKKSAKVAPHSGSELPPHPSSWTAAAQLEDSVEWVRLRDVNSGKLYFWNRRTRASAWKPPPDVKVVWNAAKNEEGARYFWHTETRVSTFDLPPLPPE